MKYDETTIVKINTILDDAASIKVEKFTPTINQAISEAASNNAPIELKQKAWLLVFNVLKTRIINMINCFDADRCDDYLNECFIVIMEHLSQWNPKRGSLLTFFKIPFIKACKNIQCADQMFDSLYYKDVYNDILKIIDELTKKGIAEPTEKQIYMALKIKGSRYSMATIHSTLEQVNRKIVSFEILNEQENESGMADSVQWNANKDTIDLSSDPINHVIEKESKNEVLQCIETLTPESKEFMKIEYRVANVWNKQYSFNSCVANEYRKCVDSTAKSVHKVRSAAEREFVHKYNNLKFG
jgi:DNA-directed RNA polymerase specialized sigma subunit